MSTSSPPPAPARFPGSKTVGRASGRAAGTNSRGRIAVAMLLIISLIASGLTRQWAMDRRMQPDAAGGEPSARPTEDQSLNALPSFATALLLGGLRGPLVMVLWPMTERQKQDKNLQDLDTEIEWIRLLQPEFDTVHLFQIWNKAYNLSVQMSSLANKYTTILDAIDYGQKVDQTRPDDINIIFTLGSVYDTKLGTSSEHPYYRGRVRRETQTLMRVSFPESREADFRAAAQKLGWLEEQAPLNHSETNHTVTVYLENALYKQLAKDFSGADIVADPDIRRTGQQDNPSWRKVRLDPLVDIDGNIFSEFIQPRFPQPSDLAADQPWYDGSQLQFLARYQPYPYGISVLALGFNDAKRSQYLLRLRNQHPISAGSSDPVVDSRPAISLEHWVSDEWERGRLAELRMVDRPGDAKLRADPKVDPSEYEGPTGTIGLNDKIVDPAAYDAALYSYRLAARLAADGRAEFLEHNRYYTLNQQTYLSHIDDMTGQHQLLQADSDFLAAMTATGEERAQLLKNALQGYNDTKYTFASTVLKYYVDEPVVLKTYPIDPATGQQFNRAAIERMDAPTVLATLERVRIENKSFFTDPQTHQYSVARDQHHDSRLNYEAYIGHCDARLSGLGAQPATQPTSAPLGSPPQTQPAFH
jgi:hypothetical protein